MALELLPAAHGTMARCFLLPPYPSALPSTGNHPLASRPGTCCPPPKKSFPTCLPGPFTNSSARRDGGTEGGRDGGREGRMNVSCPGPQTMKRYRPRPWVCPTPQPTPQPPPSPATAGRVPGAEFLTSLTYTGQCASRRQLQAPGPTRHRPGHRTGTRGCLLSEQGAREE